MSWPPPNYYPDRGTGYRLSFEEFRRLFSYRAYRASVEPLIKAWFGYDIVDHGDLVAICRPDGYTMDLQAIHDAIQSDPERQYCLYQCAMSLW
jgi:hypothetical protein